MKHTFDEIAGHVKPGPVAISEMKGVTFLDDAIRSLIDTLEGIFEKKSCGVMGRTLRMTWLHLIFENIREFFDFLGLEKVRILNFPILQDFEIESFGAISVHEHFVTLKTMNGSANRIVIVIAGGILDGLRYGQ
jgi:hypothetical protein